MFFSARQGFGNSTPLSPAEESRADEKLTLFNQNFFSSAFAFFLDVCLASFFFFEHLSAAKLSGGKERCDGVGCLWMRFKRREHFQ